MQQDDENAMPASDTLVMYDSLKRTFIFKVRVDEVFPHGLNINPQSWAAFWSVDSEVLGEM
jgi:hypothetical protein